MRDSRCVFARSAPLCVLDSTVPRVGSKVRMYLDEPLVQRMDTRKLAACCAFFNVLLQMDRDIAPMSQEIEELCQKIDPSRPYMSILCDSGILDCFPLLKIHLETIKAHGVEKNSKNKDEASGRKDYLDYVSLLNELLTMSNQILQDLGRPQNHKYMAHQVALLYQCINHVKGELKPLKKRIEERFSGLKNLVENSSSSSSDSGGARLTYFYKTWLRDLIGDIKTIVSRQPPDVIHKTITDVKK